MKTKFKFLVVALFVALGMQAQPTNQIQKLLASDGAANYVFGWSVSISGDVAIVGSHNSSGNVSGSGAAYIFYNNSGTWEQQAKLTASDGAWSDAFGVSVSISGDVAVVGADLDDDPINGDNAGAAYIFVKPAGGWADMTETAKLIASDRDSYDFFGRSVSISGEIAVVGAYSDDSPDPDDIHTTNVGSAYIFEKPVGGWADMTETDKLRASDWADGDNFGFAVCISGDVAIVGARFDDDNGSNSGSSYLFYNNSGTWEQQAKLTASDGALADEFGASVSISGDVAVVGAISDDDNGSNAGSAYIFEKPAGGWVNMTQTAKLTASDGESFDRFGLSVSISGETVVVGAPLENENGFYSGSAYIFGKPASGWADMTQTNKLTASDGTVSENFGWSVSISGDLAIVGTPYDSDNGSQSGSAYIFGLDEVNSSCDNFTVHLKDSNGDYLPDGSLEYREGGPNGWFGATEIDDGIFCIETNRDKIALRMTHSAQTKKVTQIPTNEDYTFQTELVTIELRNNGVLGTDGGIVDYSAYGWHNAGTTGDDGTGIVQIEMLADEPTFRMTYDGKKEVKTLVVSPGNTVLTFDEIDLKSSIVDGANEFQLTAYPNPFNGNATIAFSLEEAQNINISVFDQTGRLIVVLQDGMQSEGNHKISWDASGLNKGVYFVRLSSDGKVVHQNVVKM